MRKIILLFSLLFVLCAAYSQTNRQAQTDSISKKLIHLLQVHEPDSIYDMAGRLFREKISRVSFKAIAVNQLFPLNDFKNISFVGTINGINKYRVEGIPELQLLTGIDGEQKIETLLIQPYVEDKKSKDSIPLSTSNWLDN